MGNETVTSKKKPLRNSFSVDFGHQNIQKIRPSNGFKLLPILQTKQRSQLQISVNDNNQNELSGSRSQVKAINDEMRKQSAVRLKKLTSTNDELRKQLIKISTQLTQRLKKKKFQVKKIEQKEINPNKKESLKKQLQNAYKQIDMYKRVLSDLKVGSQSELKLIYVEDKINSVDIQIQNTMKQIQAIKNVNLNQVNGIKINRQKGSQLIQQLKNQIEALKLLIKQKSKQQRLKQKVYMKQHYYMKSLQNKAKQINQQQQQNIINQINDKKASQQEIIEAEKQLQLIKVKHDEYHKKINAYIAGNKVLKQQKNELKSQLQQKKKIIQGLKYKRDAFVKQIKDNLHLLATATQPKQEQMSQFQSDQQQQPDPIQEQQDERGTFDVDHLKDHNLKLISKQQLMKRKQSQLMNIKQQPYRAEPKLWKKQLTRIVSKGKQMADQKTFSTGLHSTPKIQIKIVEINVWMNKKKQITAIQPSYLVDGRVFEGSKSSKNIEDEYRVTFSLEQNDFLKSVLGIFGRSGFLQYLVLQSNFGKISKIGRQQTDGDNFAIGVAKQETPVQITGANRQDGAYWRISRLDFQVLIQI